MITLTQEVFNNRFGNLNAVKQENGKWIVNNTTKIPAIIDFNAEWCAPCKMMHPVLERLAAEYKDKLEVYSMDVDSEQELPGKFAIRSIPTLFFITSEGIVTSKSGAMSPDALKKLVIEYLNIQ
jgi:thioredoxin